jgi:tripartite-type tricarboxylate transporter receptor subunit TctC
VSWGTAGVGSYGHLLCESFKIAAGVDILHVPYRGGGESLADFLAGVHQVHADPNTLPHISGGKAKLLAVSDRQRHPLFPNVPLMKEIYPDLDYVVWFGLFAPAGTPAAIVKRMNAAVNKIIAEDKPLKEQLLKAALSPHGGSAEDMDKLMRADFERFGALTKKLKLKTE